MSDQDITTVGFCVVIFTWQYFKARIAKGCIGCVLTWCSGGYIRRYRPEKVIYLTIYKEPFLVISRNVFLLLLLNNKKIDKKSLKITKNNNFAVVFCILASIFCIVGKKSQKF